MSYSAVLSSYAARKMRSTFGCPSTPVFKGKYMQIPYLFFQERRKKGF